MSRRRDPVGLSERAAALERATRSLAEIAPDPVLRRAHEVLERLADRRALSAEHTVVGFFGATGSGKSSLVNALVGREITRAAVRRPTTAVPVAAVVGEEGSDALLDWLGVADRHVLDGSGALTDGDPAAGGMILLDLPDLDSVERGNREIAERMTGLVDVIVWVTDPQKYADDVLHHDFVAPFAGHDAVTLAVLNQIDLVREGERDAVLASLGSLLRRDGLEHAPVVGVSAQTGEGLETLRAQLVEIARGHEASSLRRRADVRQAALGLREAADPAGLAAAVRPADASALAADLAVAARIEPVARAVGASYRYRAAGHVGWPVLRWMRRFRADPLVRLRIGQGDGAGSGPSGARTGRAGGRGGAASEEALARTSLPRADAAARAQASAGLRRLADASSRGGTDPWRAAVRRAARSREEDLPDALDQVVAGADLRARSTGWWWPVLGVLQWLALATWVVGLGWLALNAGLAFLGIPPPPMPMVEDLWIPVPLPTAMIVLGVTVGILLAVAGSGIAAAVGAWHRGRARRVLRGRVRATARELVVDPVDDLLSRASATGADLDVACGTRRSRHSTARVE